MIRAFTAEAHREIYGVGPRVVRATGTGSVQPRGEDHLCEEDVAWDTLGTSRSVTSIRLERPATRTQVQSAQSELLSLAPVVCMRCIDSMANLILTPDAKFIVLKK